MKNKRILLCRTGGIGDVIHTLPLVKYLKDKYQSASIEYLTTREIAGLLENCCPFIDKVWIYDKENKKYSGEIDYFFNLHNSLSFFFFNLFHIKAKKYFGYKKNLEVHAVLNFAHTYDKNIEISSLETNTLFVNEFNNFLSQYNLSKNKYICLVPGVGNVRPHRAWPIYNWTKLANYFLEKDRDCKIVFLGGKDEEKLCSFLRSNDDKTINLIGKLSLIETAKIISQAKELISCDTGLLHIASALGIKVMGIYGPTEPKRSGPFSKNCSIVIANNCECKKDLKYCKKTNDLYSYCMNTLTIDHLMDKLKVERVLI